MPVCPVCGYTNAARAMNNPDIETVQCPGCGPYDISGTEAAQLDARPLSNRQKANASGWIRSTGPVRLSTADDRSLRNLPTPPIPDKAERFLQYLAKTFPEPGHHFGVTFDILHRPTLSAMDSAECEYIAEYCIHERKWLQGTVVPNPVQGSINALITPAGWAYLSDVSRLTTLSPYGFVAMHFDATTDALREQGIKPALRDAGYDTRLIDEVHHVNHTDDEILAAIQRSRFVVADLTGQRQNVYYEAGFAQGLKKAVFWTCHANELDANRNHFDVRQYPFIDWDDNRLEDLKLRLTARIVGVLGPGPLLP